VTGASLRKIARANPDITIWSLARHFKHLPAIIAQTTERRTQQNEASGRLPARVEQLILEAQQILAIAKTEKRWMPAVAALRENRNLIELLARLTGELGAGAGEFVPGVAVQVNQVNNNVPEQQPAKNRDAFLKSIREFYNLSPAPRSPLKPDPIM